MGFSPKIKEEVLAACGRHCCLCHKFCGIKIEIHHIIQKADGGEDSFENAIPLCFDCHADMRSYDHNHPKGTKYTATELTRHRNNWYNKISGNIGILNRSEVMETDKQVYLTLVSILPWNGTIKFLRENNFAGWSFERKVLRELDEFLYRCNDPSFEFIDPDLESSRVKLVDKINKCLGLIATNTFPTNNPGYNSVPDDWEITNPKHFEQVVKDIHNANDEVCTCYDELIRMATRKLGIIPK